MREQDDAARDLDAMQRAGIAEHFGVDPSQITDEFSEDHIRRGFYEHPVDRPGLQCIPRSEVDELLRRTAERGK